MITVFNITTRTKCGDVYDEVAINKYPIVIVGFDGRDEECLLNDSEITDVITSHIRNDATYEYAKLYIRVFDDNNEMVSEKIIMLNKKWKK